MWARVFGGASGRECQDICEVRLGMRREGRRRGSFRSTNRQAHFDIHWSYSLFGKKQNVLQ